MEISIFLFILGYEGNANSNAYKKMRYEFAHKYNLITIQCAYFGFEFMQESKNLIPLNLEMNTLENLFKKDDINKIVYW